MERHAWKKVDMSGDRRKAENSVLFFICAPVIAINLASKNRPKLLAILLLLPFGTVLSLVAISTPSRKWWRYYNTSFRIR